jgi:2-isopropylmalate synthase
MRTLTVLDTTLRDGQQAPGFAVKKKAVLAGYLAATGVDIVEVGFPLSSPFEFRECREAVAGLRDTPSVAALMCRADIAEIKQTATLLSGNTQNGVLHITLPVSDEHRKVLLGITRGELLRRAKETTAFAAGYAAKVEIGCEDASRADTEFLCEYIETVLHAGAGIVNYADTLGILCPPQTEQMITMLQHRFAPFANGTKVLSVHFHNDYGLALANTLSAIRAGCGQIEGTLCGIGERSGNASIEEVIANINAHTNIYDVITNIKPERLNDIVKKFRRELVLPETPLTPLSGWNGNAHTSGIHQKGIAGEARAYNAASKTPTRIVLSRFSGKSGIRLAAAQCGVKELTDKHLTRLVDFVKQNQEQIVSLTDFVLQLQKLKLIDELPQQPDGNVKVQTVQTLGIDGQYRVYAEILLPDGNTYSAERIGGEPEKLLNELKKEALLFQCVSATHEAGEQSRRNR